jgi:hypothetical protein
MFRLRVGESSRIRITVILILGVLIDRVQNSASMMLESLHTHLLDTCHQQKLRSAGYALIADYCINLCLFNVYW